MPSSWLKLGSLLLSSVRNVYVTAGTAAPGRTSTAQAGWAAASTVPASAVARAAAPKRVILRAWGVAIICGNPLWLGDSWTHDPPTVRERSDRYKPVPGGWQFTRHGTLMT